MDRKRRGGGGGGERDRERERDGKKGEIGGWRRTGKRAPCAGIVGERGG